MLVALSSATSAERMKKLLAKGRVDAQVIQSPKSISDGGCGYALRIKDEYLNEVKNTANMLKISIRGIYYEEGTKGNRTYRKSE